MPHSKGGRGEPWKAWEDALIRLAADDNAKHGIVAFRPRGRARGANDYANRLREIARKTNRTYAAVRQRAYRIGAHSYRREEGRA